MSTARQSSHITSRNTPSPQYAAVCSKAGGDERMQHANTQQQVLTRVTAFMNFSIDDAPRSSSVQPDVTGTDTGTSGDDSVAERVFDADPSRTMYVARIRRSLRHTVTTQRNAAPAVVTRPLAPHAHGHRIDETA
jgi:hypothetical protein